MKIDLDCHTHTIASGHAYSTLEENIKAAAAAKLSGLAITDHGPAMPGGPHDIYFMNLRALPTEHLGVSLFRGIEANIIDYEGNLDLPEYPLKNLDFCIASYHEICISPKSEQAHTLGWLNVIKNKYVDLLGHPGRGRFPFDIRLVAEACAENNKAIEINNHTLNRDTDRDFCKEIALVCKELKVPVMVNSDAHFTSSIGQFSRSLDLLAEIDFPEELIVNRSLDSFREFFMNRGKKWRW